MTIDRDALRAAAWEATPGSWSRCDPPWGDCKMVYTGSGDPHGQWPIADCDPSSWLDDVPDNIEPAANAAFIAAASPATVLALLDMLDAAERRIAELE